MLFEVVESCAISSEANRNRLTANKGKIEKPIDCFQMTWSEAKKKVV